ncbi:hypothetical protein C8Q75DRAFT_589095 [Abortiporus biennis]|nr:hypothetical protein C8Q75DRAFT_589095 [Abortiporus biennis]
MRFAAALSALSFAAIAAAQDATIQVGATAATAGGIFQFMPPTINATKGSTITFVFSGAPGNHTVTQSTFASPCQQAPGGFDSGYIQIPAGTTGGFPTWNLTITDDTKPIWFFCAQLAPAPHCTAGMVGYVKNDSFETNYSWR